MLHIALTVLILWLLIYHMCPKSKTKIEFFIGKINFSFPFSGNNLRRKYLPIGDMIPNCGIETSCPENHFALHIHTGRSVVDKPKICIGGKYVVHESIKNGLRGFNVVVVDSRRREAVAANGFDDGYRNSKELETFLANEVQEEDIIISMTYDDASAKLTGKVKSHFGTLGSGLIQNLQLKDQWYMVSQKGIDGFSPYEELLPFKRGRFDVLSRRFCVPTQIKGRSIVPDPPVQNNFMREKFCHRHPEIVDFCSPSNILDELKPGVVMIPKHTTFPFYQSPVIVLALRSLSSLTLTLETVLSQSKIQPQNVRVVYNPQRIRDVSQLSNLFGFKPVQAKAKEFWEMLQIGLDDAVKEFPKALYVTVIEEGVVLSPDFSSFVSKISELLEDPLALGVSAWNPNGFSEVSSRDDLIYRVQSLSWLAFTLKMSTYTQLLKPQLRHCCNKRGWLGWTLPDQEENGYILIPDVSRCSYYANDGEVQNDSTFSFFAALFHRERKTNLNPLSKVQDIASLQLANYDANLHSILNSNRSRKLNITKDQVLSFYEHGSLRLLFSYLSNENRTLPVYVLSFIEAKPSTLEGMKMLCRCFGLFYHADSKPLGLYKGILRFSVNEIEFMLLSSLSTFFQKSSYNLTSLVLP